MDNPKDHNKEDAAEGKFQRRIKIKSKIWEIDLRLTATHAS